MTCDDDSDSKQVGTEAKQQPVAAAVVGKLSPGQARYQRQGFLCPFPGLAPAETRDALEGFRRCVEQKGASDYSMLHASHPWLCKVARHPFILEAVSVVLQSDSVYLISSHLFARAPGQSLQSTTGLHWHRDGQQYLRRLEPVDSTHFVTAFVALSPCDQEHGCLCARPLCGGDEVHLELQPGEFSLHGPFTEHTGVRNCSAEVRYCIALRYVAASTRCLEGRKPALLLRGTDPEGHFEQIPEPTSEDDPMGVMQRRVILQKWAQSSWDTAAAESNGAASRAEVAEEAQAAPRHAKAAGPARVSQLWQVVCGRVSVRDAPRPGAAALAALARGDVFFVCLVYGDWVCIDRRGKELDKTEAPLPQQWVLTVRQKPTPLQLLQRVW